MARLRRNIQTPKPATAKAAKPPITPPAIAPAFDDFWGFAVVVLIGPVMIDDGGREVLDSETVEGTGATSSGRPPAALAATGSNLSPT
jgi:hypothetical protein